MRPEVGRIQSLGLVMACAAIAACAPAKITTTVSPALEQYQVRSIVMMPFDRLMTPQILDSPESQFSVPRGARRSDIQVPPAPSGGHLDRETSTVPSVVPEKIGDMVYRNLVKRGGLQVRPQEEAAAAIRATGSGAPDTLPQQTAKDVIRNTRSDAALLGRVLVYRERDGSRWGANPAIVGFEIKLVGSDGIILWTANYYEKQRPLIEDFTGFWQHGGGFVTADELAEYGADRIVRQFPFGNP